MKMTRSFFFGEGLLLSVYDIEKKRGRITNGVCVRMAQYMRIRRLLVGRKKGENAEHVFAAVEKGKEAGRQGESMMYARRDMEGN